MSRIHDVGGMHGFGDIVVESEDTTPFEHLWEARVFALMKVCMDQGLFTPDEARHAIERLPPSTYLEASYYEKWYLGLRTMLLEKGIIHESDLEAAES